MSTVLPTPELRGSEATRVFSFPEMTGDKFGHVAGQPLKLQRSRLQGGASGHFSVAYRLHMCVPVCLRHRVQNFVSPDVDK